MSNIHFIPENTRVYAIGDIHGMASMMDDMHAKIADDIAKNPILYPVIVYLGDYIDRGEDNRGVIETLIDHSKNEDGVQRHFLLGNHEDAMLAFMKDPLMAARWLEFGGIETMRDYGLEFGSEMASATKLEEMASRFKSAVPKLHIDFLQSLKTKVEIGDYLFVHAGIDPSKPIEQQSKGDLTFIRGPFLNYEGSLPKRVVHGHTPVKKPESKHNRINVDTGAVFGGDLTCVVLEVDQERFLQVQYPA